MRDVQDQPGALAGGPARARQALAAVRRAAQAAPLDASLPQLLVTQAVAAAGGTAGILYGVFGDLLIELARQQDSAPALAPPGGPVRLADQSRPATRAVATGCPLWLTSRADLAARFPQAAGLPGPGELAGAALPLLAGGAPVGVLGLRFAGCRDFSQAERAALRELADVCAARLPQWRRPAAPGMQVSSAAELGALVHALSRAATADDVARVIAEKGATAGAAYAIIAVREPAAGAAARIYHPSSIAKDVADRHPVIPAGNSTPLGTVLAAGGEVWQTDPASIAAGYPGQLPDLIRSGAAAAASLALTDRRQRVIGGMGMAWHRAQAFTEGQKSEIRVVARLAADALSRVQQLETERAARQRTERLQNMMTALVASASLDEVKASVFEHGLLPFGASAARLVLADQREPGQLTTVNAVGLPEPALSNWRRFPLSVRSPSRQAMDAGTVTYAPTPADMAREFPEAGLSHAHTGARAWAAVPLRSGGATLGVLSLIFESEHPLDEGRDQLALTALGSAIADALSRAAQHDSDRDVIASLQRSLLAAELPEQPQVRLGARYLPAEARYGIGGDWYDAIPLPGGRLMLIVGDVAGHGLDAAIGMGQIRSAARALALTYPPAGLLAVLDQFICGTLREPLATAAAVIIDPARRTVRYCLAGHPPPLLREPGGTVTALGGASGVLLGLETRDRPEHVAAFAPGSALVLFTDGLFERRDEDADAGLARLAGQLADPAPRDPGQLCDELVRHSAARNGRADDTAVLCAYLS